MKHIIFLILWLFWVAFTFYLSIQSLTGNEVGFDKLAVCAICLLLLAFFWDKISEEK